MKKRENCLKLAIFVVLLQQIVSLTKVKKLLYKGPMTSVAHTVPKIRFVYSQK
jgi:hypothetical protein